jgi:hypothetical protein
VRKKIKVQVRHHAAFANDNKKGYSQQYACVLQDDLAQLASKIYAEINKPAAGVGDYLILIDVECSYIGEWVGTEYNVALAACYHPLLDGKGVKKVDFLDVR